MTAINWKSGVSGDWSLNTNGNPATVPGSGDAVTIAAASAVPYAVTHADAEPEERHRCRSGDADEDRRDRLVCLGRERRLTPGWSQTKRSIGVARDGERLLPTFPGWAASAAVPRADYCGRGKVSTITLMVRAISIHGCNGR